MRLSIFDRFFRRSTTEIQPRAAASAFEPLENRTLLSGATITGVTADNRGQVVISLSAPVVAADVNAGAVQMYTTGPDKILGTADDAQVTVGVHYTVSNNRITIDGTVLANQAYRIKLVATRLRDAQGTPIDGEFAGHFPTGNHKAGGNFEMQVKTDKSATPTARLSTSLGTLDIKLFEGATKTNIATPNNVAGFLFFANAGDYDNLVITRVDPDQFIQMGAIKLAPQNQVITNPGLPTGAVIQGEPGNSNVRGTVSFALAGGPNTASNEFFFNVGNNTELDTVSDSGGPFTAFGAAANARSLGVLDAINGLNRLNLTASLGSVVLANNFPVNADVPVTGETTGLHGQGGSTTKILNAKTDFIIVARTALLMRVVPMA